MTHGTLFESLRSFEDPRIGIREEFFQPTIGGGTTIGVLSSPVRDPASLGWVFCHSFGLEQIYLNPMEVPMARRLSAMGFPVLRFHCQGYGDSELPVDSVTVTSHIENTLDAVDVLRRASGVERVGFFGARFGGAVATIAADRTNAPALITWDPIVSGRTFANALVRQDLLADIGLAHTRVQDPVEILRRDGIVDLQGFPLRIEVFEQLAALDLRNDVVSFHGDALLLQVGQTNHPRMDLQRLIERIESLGGHCRFEAIQGDRRRPFGAPRFQALGAHRGKVDTHAQLAVDLEALTAEWAGPLLGANAPAAHPSGGAG